MVEYRKCVEFPLYIVNKDGDIRNRKTGKKVAVDKNGNVQLRKDGKYHHRSALRLAKTAFPTNFLENF